MNIFNYIKLYPSLVIFTCSSVEFKGATSFPTLNTVKLFNVCELDSMKWYFNFICIPLVTSSLGHDHYNLFYFLHCINMSLSEIILSCVYWCIYFLCCLECKLLDCRILIMLHTGVPLYLTQNRNNKHSRNE